MPKITEAELEEMCIARTKQLKALTEAFDTMVKAALEIKQIAEKAVTDAQRQRIPI